MSERYAKLFSLAENLYSEGSPAVISAGALLKDNQTGKVSVQLKIKNIGAKVIKAAKVAIQPLDTVGAKLGGEVGYTYLDLSAHRDEEFGQKTLIPLPDRESRGFEVRLTEAVFTDNTVWKENGGVWESLPTPKSIDSIWDAELVKQYRIHYGENSTARPMEVKDLWYCACGALNREGKCYKCGKSFAELNAVDMEALKAERDERLAKEKAETERKTEEARIAAEKASKKRKNAISIAAPIVIAFIAFLIVLTKVIIPNSKYNAAITLMEDGKYNEAIAAFEAMDGYKDSADLIKECNYNAAVVLMNEGKYEDAITAFERMSGYKDSAELIHKSLYSQADEFLSNGDKSHAAMVFFELVDYSDAKERSLEIWDDIAVRETISAGSGHTVGLKTDGTVVTVGNNTSKQCNTSKWTDIVAVSAGDNHTVGLKSDGTVVAVGSNAEGQCDVSGWKDIVAISAGAWHTVGLKADGTVVAVGLNNFGQCDVFGWKDIVAISAGNLYTVGLKTDGTIVAVGSNKYGQSNVSHWKGIVAISAGGYYTVNLKADGTVVAVGGNDYGQCDVSGWKNIVAVSAGGYYTVGLRSDGTVVAVGSNYDGECDVSGWTNIKFPD